MSENSQWPAGHEYPNHLHGGNKAHGTQIEYLADVAKRAANPVFPALATALARPLLPKNYLLQLLMDAEEEGFGPGKRLTS